MPKQGFWKFSSAKGVSNRKFNNKIFIENNLIVIWGWDGVIDFDMRKLNKTTKNEFDKAVKNVFDKKRRKSGGPYPGHKQLADFYFLQEGDIIFLYGDPFSIDAIGVVEGDYEYSPVKYKEIFSKYYENGPEEEEIIESHLRRINWKFDNSSSPRPITIKDENLKKKISGNATIIELDENEAISILNLAKQEKSDTNLSEFIQNFKVDDEHELSEAEIKEAGNEIEDISSKPFNMLSNSRNLLVSKRKARDAAFAIKIVTNYDGKCAICGNRWKVDSSFEVEAAHIIPVEYDGPDDVRNGFALCRFHHWAFDKGVFSVDDNYRIIVSPKVKEFSESFEALKRFEGNSINLPKEENLHPHKDALKYHRDNVFIRQ